MIKNRITPEIKKAFLEEIKKTRDSGKEQGFLICLDENDNKNGKDKNGKNNKNGRLYASKKRCTGEECGFVIKDVHEYCPDKVQGAFHTHPYFINVERFYDRKPTEKETEHAIKPYKKHFEIEKITLTTPSHHDVVDTLLSQCIGESEGTVCTVGNSNMLYNDLDLEKVECWTVKGEKVKIRDCSRAKEELKERIADQPRNWIKPLFHKEIISLKTKKWWI